MPTVKSSGNQVARREIPNARFSVAAPAEVFGAGRSAGQADEARRGVLSVTQKIVAEEKKKADDVAVMMADRQLSELQTQLQVESAKKRGTDAFGAHKYAKEEWDKQSQKILAGLHNDTQKGAAHGSATNRWESLNRTVQTHMAGQAKELEENETQSYLATNRDNAKLNSHDNFAVGESIGKQRQAIDQWAERNGLTGTETHKARLSDEVSSTHREVISSRLAAGKDLFAKEYFEGVKQKGELTAKDLGALEGALKEGSIRGESQRQATSIMGKYGDDMKSALEAARKIKSPDVQDRTVSELKTRFAEKENIDRDSQEKLFQKAFNFADQNLKEPDPATWEQLKPNEKSAISSWLQKKRSGEHIQTNWDSYYNLKTMASAPETRDEFLKMNLMLERSNMADSEFKEMINLQASLRKGDEKAEKALDDFRSVDDMVNTSLRIAGIDPSPKDGDKSGAEKVAQFKNAVAKEQRSLQERTGKKATHEELQGIVDNLIIQGTVKGTGLMGFFSTKRRIFEREPGEVLEFDAKSIPISERSKIEAALKRRGLPVSDDRVMALYRTKLQRVGKNAD